MFRFRYFYSSSIITYLKIFR